MRRLPSCLDTILLVCPSYIPVVTPRFDVQGNLILLQAVWEANCGDQNSRTSEKKKLSIKKIQQNRSGVKLSKRLLLQFGYDELFICPSSIIAAFSGVCLLAFLSCKPHYGKRITTYKSWRRWHFQTEQQVKYCSLALFMGSQQVTLAGFQPKYAVNYAFLLPKLYQRWRSTSTCLWDLTWWMNETVWHAGSDLSQVEGSY